MTAAVELTAAWWMEPTGTGRVRRFRGEIMNLAPGDAARLVSLGAAKQVGAPPAAESGPRKAPSRRKAPAKKPEQD